MGIMDWQEVMRALRGIDYTGDFTFETHRFTQEIPDALIPAALRYSRQVGEYVLTL